MPLLSILEDKSTDSEVRGTDNIALRLKFRCWSPESTLNPRFSPHKFLNFMSLQRTLSSESKNGYIQSNLGFKDFVNNSEVLQTILMYSQHSAGLGHHCTPRSSFLCLCIYCQSWIHPELQACAVLSWTQHSSSKERICRVGGGNTMCLEVDVIMMGLLG